MILPKTAAPLWIFRSTSILIFFWLLTTGCDRCKDVECYNGGECDRGKCACQDGYAGPECSISLVPKSIIIDSVRFSHLSDYLLKEWDVNEEILHPDVFMKVSYEESGEVLIDQSEFYENTTADTLMFTSGFPLSINRVTEKVRFELFYRDAEWDQSMLVAWTLMYWRNNGYPEKHAFDHEFLQLKIEIWLRYEF